MSSIAFVVDRRENGQTLASVLKMRYGLSWSQAKRLVERRHVKVSGQVETDAARRLKVGKRVELAAGTVEGQKSENPKAASAPVRPKAARPSASPRKVHPQAPGSRAPVPKPKPAVAGIEIVYSDEFVVVVNKPAGLTTMRHKEEAAEFGARGRKFLPTTLAELLPQLLGLPDRPVIAVHRIDKDTSGLVVFARTHSAADKLRKQFRKHTVDRRYLALTRGVPPARRIESVLVADRGDGRRGSTIDPKALEGKKAVTHFKVIEDWQRFAVVECRLETGRTHQVRIHLGEAGTPLCGEAVYDRPVHGKPIPDGSGAERPMLHAARLGFNHPEHGETMVWEVPPPEDFVEVREKIQRV
jgi:23S rRNA pseudouridine1911/1915/1917 synthase